ncbi:prickle-like protein 4 isoform X1 [Antechinus flavipes]|uniref:prickle-like protein 4 isoform X1 n=1 Tax=Antechinus flavipes TaxID=38775 RepID=UPI0022363C57|nr:prickle-like protein 4 isoform X1 [Antechinus flavipes]XP_051852902.1 prickle-like protein 4 isoform X1 [Antechinus flavipes]
MLVEFTEVCSQNHQEDKSTSRDQETSVCLLDSESYCTLEEEGTYPLPSQVPAHHDLESFHVESDNSPNWLRIRTLLQQLPPQDSDERYCSMLGEEERFQLRLFSAHRRQQALGQGIIRMVPPRFEGHMCEKCGTNLKPGEPGVFAARAGEKSCWHPDCFTCQACSQALLDLIYFYHKGHLYCGRHHAELLRPRCPACDQLIFSGRCTEAAGRHWHENHFCCLDCTRPLTSGQYALPGSGPCCPRCFEIRLHSDLDPSQSGGGEAFASQSNDPTIVSSTSCHENGMEQPRDSLEKDEISQSFLNSAGILEEGHTGRRLSRSLRTPLPGEEGPCPTCSSSSDSEPDGFFLGQPLPQPGAGSLDAPGSLHLHAGGRAPGRQCRVC